MKDNKKENKKKKRKGRPILMGILIILLITFSAGAGISIAVIKSAPTIDLNFYDNLMQSGKLYDKDENYIENLSDVENRTIVPLKRMPKNLQNAFIAIEDERYWTHHGVDVKRIFGAIWYDIRTMSKAQGASTITQQLVKNYVLSPEKKFTRKLQEAYLSIKLERMLSKEQILEYYLNTIFLGGNAYGVQSASMLYFGKDVEELDLSECALIAGLTKNPAKYYPYSKRNKENPQAYIDRQKIVLKSMLKNKLITQEEYENALNKPLVFKTKETTSSVVKHQWFVEAAIDQIAKDFSIKYGVSESEAKQKLRTSGYNMYLTIDTKMQEKTESVIENSKYYPKIPASKAQYAKNPKDKKLIQPQAAAVIIDVATGEVRAIVGGRGPHPLQSYNRATDTDIARQPGSSIKPLAVYAPAIESKIATAATVIEDSPMPEDFVKANGGWDPKNYDNKFKGYVTVRNAIKDSINLVAVKLEQMVGINTGISFLRNKFHISTVDTEGSTNDKNLAALALGGMSNGVTPLEMAAAYSVFANGGLYSEPIMYTKVTDNKGKVILEKLPNTEKSLSPQGAYMMSNLLETVVKSGTGKKAKLGNMPTAGKTGTSDDHTNGWFVGFTPYYAGAVWMGHDDKNYAIKGLVGGTVAPVWHDIMLDAHKGLEVKNFPGGTNIITAEVCMDSGKAPSDLCSKDPRGSRVYTEMFIDGTQPVEICDIHVAANIDKTNGKLATPATSPENIITKIYIKRAVKSRKPLADDPYVLPTEYSTAPPAPTEPTNPTDPTDPGEPTDPANPKNPTEPPPGGNNTGNSNSKGNKKATS